MFLHRDFVLSSVQIIINVWSQNKVMLFFVALIFLEEQEVKSYCIYSGFCHKELSHIFSKVNRNWNTPCAFTHQRRAKHLTHTEAKPKFSMFIKCEFCEK